MDFAAIFCAISNGKKYKYTKLHTGIVKSKTVQKCCKQLDKMKMLMYNLRYITSTI